LDTNEIILENTQRHKQIDKPYNPVTGEGCQGERVQICIEDAPLPLLYLPKPMMKLDVCKKLLKYGSIKKLLEASKEDTAQGFIDRFWIEFCETRYKFDFEYFAITCDTIFDKVTADPILFKINRGQRRLLDRLEKMRVSGSPIRVILLKARQWGGSTLIQLYMHWIQTIHKKNWNSVICAHVNQAAINIRAMFSLVVSKMIPICDERYELKPFEGTQNIKILSGRGCRITVGSAETPESVRSQDAKMVHFSEVGLYPNTEMKKTDDLISSIVGSIPRVPLTLVAYESTAKGVGDFFHTEWQKSKNGESVFDPVFVPWYLIDMYREPFDGTYYNHRGRKVKGSISDFIKTFTEYETNLFINHIECTLENINWYRGKLSEMTSHSLMKQEFPSDDIEAFQDSGQPVFRAEDVEALRKDCRFPTAIGDISGDCNPSTAKLFPSKRKEVLLNVKFTEDRVALEGFTTSDTKTRNIKERNKLKIWNFPELEKISDRYVVVVDTGGRSEKADYSVITVFDRYWMMYGGKPEVVAEWKGHIDHDLLVWISTQIAVYYNHALLVIESNTHDTEKNEGDHTEFIFDTIAEFYDNLYSRTPADKIIEGEAVVYGFHMNTSTKTMIIDDYVASLRERGYKERSEEALNEARVFEKKKNGSFGAKLGAHDDILITRMIGNHICYTLPIPRIIEITHAPVRRRVVNESSF
jgi:hypothetical protein